MLLIVTILKLIGIVIVFAIGISFFTSYIAIVIKNIIDYKEERLKKDGK